MDIASSQLENIIKEETKKFLSELKLISEEEDVKKFIDSRRKSSSKTDDYSWFPKPEDLFYPWQTDERKFSNELKKLTKIDPDVADQVKSLALNVKDPAWWNKPQTNDPAVRGKVNLLQRLGLPSLAKFVDASATEYNLGPIKFKPDLGVFGMLDNMPGLTGKMSRALTKAGYDPATPKSLQMRRDIEAAERIKDAEQQKKLNQVKDWKQQLELLNAGEVLKILKDAKGAVKSLTKPKEPSFLDKLRQFNPMNFKTGGFEE